MAAGLISEVAREMVLLLAMTIRAVTITMSLWYHHVMIYLFGVIEKPASVFASDALPAVLVMLANDGTPGLEWRRAE